MTGKAKIIKQLATAPSMDMKSPKNGTKMATTTTTTMRMTLKMTRSIVAIHFPRSSSDICSILSQSSARDVTRSGVARMIWMVIMIAAALLAAESGNDA